LLIQIAIAHCQHQQLTVISPVDRFSISLRSHMTTLNKKKGCRRCYFDPPNKMSGRFEGTRERRLRASFQQDAQPHWAIKVIKEKRLT
jgi:hypothetical protein